MKKKGMEPFPRRAGILLPVSSLPSKYGIGTLGKEAYQFVDFLHLAGQSYWQVLPIGPTSFGDSPYQSFSAFAGNPYLIDLETLLTDGLLVLDELEQCDWGEDPAYVAYDKIYESRFSVLRKAFGRSSHSKTKAYRSFCAENEFWLEDYALYMALKFHFDNQEWLSWPEDIRLHQPDAVKQYADSLKEETDFWKFCQYKFYEQWSKLKTYANWKGIKIIGDVPIYVAMDSADTWSKGELFQLKEDHTPSAVAGVPPDNFSADGQLWGNPLYDWEKMEQDGFSWWKRRILQSVRIYDMIRIDHFIGITQYYSIPAGSKTAQNGVWRKGPGKKLTDAIQTVLGEASILAEDLGVSVPAVKALLQKTGYPGMKILQFAFDSGAQNEHLPHHYTQNCVVYPGTHDNETLAGRVENMTKQERRYAMRYLDVNKSKELPKAILRAGCASVANTFLCQMQDVLGLSNHARMNFPSTLGGLNWRWRLTPEQLTEKTAKKLYKMCKLYGRLPKGENTAKEKKE